MFRDRKQAGRALARKLREIFDAEPLPADPLVLALPRGGVPVALEVARALDAPLDLLVARKIGVPFQPELAAGAVVDGDQPELIVNQDVLDAAGLSETDLEPIMARELAEIERRRDRYLKKTKREPIEGRTVIVVDDGIATGATVRAALIAIRRRNPRSLILAVPVAPRDVVERLARKVDRVVCLEVPEHFVAIGPSYSDFGQVTDEEVIRCLEEAATMVHSGDE